VDDFGCHGMTNVGFTATTAEMLMSTTYRDIRIALRAGSIVRLRPGLYGRPGEDPARSAASRLDGVVSHASAAEHWDLPVLNRPDVPQVTVPRKRKRRPGPPVELHWADLSVAEREAGVTEPLRTVWIVRGPSRSGKRWRSPTRLFRMGGSTRLPCVVRRNGSADLDAGTRAGWPSRSIRELEAGWSRRSGRF
jgi:hypothetical protein